MSLESTHISRFIADHEPITTRTSTLLLQLNVSVRTSVLVYIVYTAAVVECAVAVSMLVVARCHYSPVIAIAILAMTK